MQPKEGRSQPQQAGALQTFEEIRKESLWPRDFKSSKAMADVLRRRLTKIAWCNRSAWV